MTMLAVLMFIGLAAIAGLHAAWGFGMRWPARNERDLVALVVGRRGQSWVPTLAQCLLAATAILAAGLVALLMANIIRLPVPPALVTAAGAGATLVFLARGVAAYTTVWRDAFSQEPFATMDRAWYAPLCFLFAAGFALLLAARWSA
jgi:hypothetical protein